MRADITADTALPSQFGGQYHYPQTCAGVVVTMPGPDNTPIVFPTLCGTVYARRPREREPGELTLCTSCAELRTHQRANRLR